MIRYVVTISGEETRWEARTHGESRAVGDAHSAFVEASAAGGHELRAGVELAVELRPTTHAGTA